MTDHGTEKAQATSGVDVMGEFARALILLPPDLGRRISARRDADRRFYAYDGPTLDRATPPESPAS